MKLKRHKRRFICFAELGLSTRYVKFRIVSETIKNVRSFKKNSPVALLTRMIHVLFIRIKWYVDFNASVIILSSNVHIYLLLKRDRPWKERICSSRSIFSYIVDLILYCHVVQAREQEVKKVVPLCKKGGKHRRSELFCALASQQTVAVIHVYELPCNYSQE